MNGVTIVAEMETRHRLLASSYHHLWISKLPERETSIEFSVLLFFEWSTCHLVGSWLRWVICILEGPFVLTRIDVYSWCRFTFPASRALACITVQEFAEYLIHRHGTPPIVASNQGTHLTMEVWEWAHDHRTCSSFYKPPSPEEPIWESNGMACWWYSRSTTAEAILCRRVSFSRMQSTHWIREPYRALCSPVGRPAGFRNQGREAGVVPFTTPSDPRVPFCPLGGAPYRSNDLCQEHHQPQRRINSLTSLFLLTPLSCRDSPGSQLW